MNKKNKDFVILKFKNKFSQHKSPILINNIDIKIAVSNKVSFSKKVLKYIFCYNNAKKTKLFYISLSKTIDYRRDFDETKYRYFLIKDDELSVN